MSSVICSWARQNSSRICFGSARRMSTWYNIWSAHSLDFVRLRMAVSHAQPAQEAKNGECGQCGLLPPVAFRPPRTRLRLGECLGDDDPEGHRDPRADRDLAEACGGRVREDSVLRRIALDERTQRDNRMRAGAAPDEPGGGHGQLKGTRYPQDADGAGRSAVAAECSDGPIDERAAERLVELGGEEEEALAPSPPRRLASPSEAAGAAEAAASCPLHHDTGASSPKGLDGIEEMAELVALGLEVLR